MYRPSKRPSVNKVEVWDTLYNETMDYDWRGLGGGTVIVQVGYPFPDFYKVRYKMGNDTKWSQKLFYGETAYYKVRNFVYDLGFRDIVGVPLY